MFKDINVPLKDNVMLNEYIVRSVLQVCSLPLTVGKLIKLHDRYKMFRFSVL
jgi:uncharacterized protein YbgA (DUF1722 family)